MVRVLPSIVSSESPLSLELVLAEVVAFGSMKNANDSTVPASPEYRQFIEDLKTRVVSARISAARAVCADMILLYWDIGRGIVEK